MRFTTSTRLLVLLAVMALIVPGFVMAQSNTQGALSGMVTDPSNAVLPGVTVTLKSLDSGFTASATTTASGSYAFPLVVPGNYLLTVSASGFKQFSAKTTVVVGVATTVNARLEVGTAGTTVEVSGEAPLLNVETSDNSTAFDQNLVANIPNGGNDLTAVAYTAPGVMMNTAGGMGNFNVNGLPATSNMFVVDGENQMDPFLNLNNSGPTNLMLGKNSIQEATVVTDSISGQYGQQAGAQVNYVSKGGTNNWHGNVNYQWTGRYLDANDWFNGGINGSVTPAPFANNNQWSASFGGPIKKDKFFFFVDTEGIRYIVPSTGTQQIPTQDFLTDVITNLGTIGASANTIATYTAAKNLWAAAPGSANHVLQGASSCNDPLTGAVVDAPSSGSCFENFSASPALPASETLLIGRFDWNITSKDRAFFRGDLDTGHQATFADPISSKFSAASYQPEYNNNLTWNHAFSGTMTNQFVAALSYYRAIFDENTNGSTSPFPYSLYVGATGAVAISPVGLGSATGLNEDNFVFPQGRNVTQYQFVDDFAKVMGRHALKFGANFRRYDISNYDASVLVTPLVYSALGDFFNGQSDIYVQNNTLKPSAPMNTGGLGLYVQDEWSVKSNLKLTFVLRGEHNFNPTCDTNCFTLPKANFGSIFNQGASTPYNQALNIGRKDAFNSVQTLNLSPRIGFTWSPRGDKTVVSGGFSLLYDAFPAFITDNFVNVPYLIGVTQVSPLFGGANPVNWADPNGAAAVTAATANTIRNGNSALGIPSLANGLTASGLALAGGAPPSITGFPGTLKTPQVQEWNFSIQQALSNKDKLTIQYTGNHGIYEAYPNGGLNAGTSALFNPCPSPGTPACPTGEGTYSPNIITGYPTCTPAPYGTLTTQGSCSSIPDSRFGTYQEFYSGAVSNFNGLTASYSRRATAGLVVNAAFTWAHSLDEISNGGLNGYGVTSILTQINPLSLRANNYGNADYDIRKAFNANYVWTEPFHVGNRLANALFGGWMLSENFFVRGGVPYTVVDGTTSLGNATGATVVPAQVIGPGQQTCRNGFSACFNGANFAASTNLGTFPNQMRNQYRGPAFFNSDVTAGKTFHMTERVRMTIGMNVYNIFNRANFQNPNRTWTPSDGSGGPCSTLVPGGHPACGFITGQAAPPTGPYGSFFQGLPAGREGQLQAKIEF